MEFETLITKTPAFMDVLEKMTSHSRQMVTGLTDMTKVLWMAEIFKARQGSQIIITDNNYHAQQMLTALRGYLGSEFVYDFPVDDSIAIEQSVASPQAQATRLDTLKALIGQEPVIVVTTIAGARKKLIAPSKFSTAHIAFNFEDEYELGEVQEKLQTLGYRMQAQVEKPGDMAIRGSIVDIYPLNMENPIRLDFFDTQLDSIRSFDINSQRSIENLEQINVLPATEQVLTAKELADGQLHLMERMQAQRQELVGAHKKHLTDHFDRLFDQLTPENKEINLYLENFTKVHSIIDYLSLTGLIIFDDLAHLLETEKQIDMQNASWLTEQLAQQAVLADINLGDGLHDLVRTKKQPQLLVTHLQKGIGNFKLTNLINVKNRIMQEFFSQLPLLKDEIERWLRQKYTIILVAISQERQLAIQQILQDFEIKTNLVATNNILQNVVQVVELPINQGFELLDQKVAVITENELFNQVKVQRPKQARPKISNTERIKSYAELKVGDYVVHINHGIGVYEGIHTLTVKGLKQDYIKIGYQKDAKIFIPVTQLNLIQKYVGAEDKQPKINRLGGSEWAKTKRKVATQIEDIADELIDLYAKRDAAKGFAFTANPAAMAKFTDAFIYTETPDQLRSTDEVLADMQKAKPMDRLLVGDVGFGKTEVAFRAAYQAFLDNKQVAILVPTTILAQQHFESMQERFGAFGVRIALLSRFQTKQQVKLVLEQVAQHQIDMVVGTHRVLSKDVQFADLGLLIVDEEQRFGVKHKERLKALKNNVDVLTLTATPIPRTLHMSMLGVRDLSVIETPPANRYPIQTYVIEQNGDVIASAIEKEISRQGQVFYLHNRVEDIEKVADYLKMLVPNARVAYAHGQMTEIQLENVLYNFINKEYDVLVATTIIETGVDIPNANTLIIERADHMGLAQLYQLRGRVGRSARIAYAYFTYPENQVLNEESEKRLAAIRDFTELGSGFKIAMRDLSIRGAGNLLGKQQHGFIDSVGYDLYVQMLKEAVDKKQGKVVLERTDAEINLGIEAYIPDSYITNPLQKIEMYQKIRQAQQVDANEEVVADLIDRFGDYPVEVENLIQVSEIKQLADLALVNKIEKTDHFIFVSFNLKNVFKTLSKELIASLDKTKFRSVISEATDSIFKIKFIIQPTMHQQDWLDELKLYLNVVALIIKGANEVHE